jgi:ankyrin repeat protein
VTDANGNTALHYAMKNGNLAVARVLAKAVDVTAVNKKGETALSIAINKGHNDILDLFKGKTDINNQDENGETLLHYIIRDPLLNNSIDFVFESNPDVNIINNKGENIFQYFVRIVQENLKNKYGQDKEEEIQRLSDIAKRLIHAKAPDSGYAICEMINQSELEIANRMKLAGADLTNILVCPGIWKTDWILPEKMGNLIRFGANVNAIDKETGMTPLKYATKTDAGQIVINFLKQQGAKE